MARSLSLAGIFSLLITVAACSPDETPPGEAMAFDPCQPLLLMPDPAATAGERDGIAAGAHVMVAQLVGIGGAGTLVPLGSLTCARAGHAAVATTATSNILWIGRFTTRAPA